MICWLFFCLFLLTIQPKFDIIRYHSKQQVFKSLLLYLSFSNFLIKRYGLQLSHSFQTLTVFGIFFTWLENYRTWLWENQKLGSGNLQYFFGRDLHKKVIDFGKSSFWIFDRLLETFDFLKTTISKLRWNVHLKEQVAQFFLQKRWLLIFF